MRPLHFVIPALLPLALADCGGGGGSTPAPLVLTVDGLPAGDKLGAVGTYALSVSETRGGQTVTPGSVTFRLDTGTIGTITGSTLVTGPNNASGHITATDASNGVTGTVAVTVLSTRPATSGDAVAFAGTLIEKIVRPLPAPTAVQPPYTYTYAVAINSTASNGKTFAGKTGLNDFTTVETDTGSLPPLPVTTTDTYENYVPAAGGSYDVLSYGTQARDSNGSAFTTTLGTGNQLLDILPETNGAAWQHTAAETYAESEADSTSIARTVNADGSYTETDNFADKSIPAATIAVAPDLSGSYTNLFYVGGINGPGGINLAFGVPTAGNIPITIVAGGVPTLTTVPDWYPSAHLFTDATTLSTGKTIPSTCLVPASLGTTGNEILETTTRLDPVLGTYETRSDQTYLIAGYGPACTVLADTFDDYYDYSGQTSTLFANVPQQITTLTETLGFRSGTIAGAVAPAASERRTSAIASVQNRSVVAAARASFRRAVQRLYRERRRALRTYIEHTSKQRMGR